MMEALNKWWNRRRLELDAARAENREARERVAKTIAQASEEGVTVSLSRAALERIGAHGPNR